MTKQIRTYLGPKGLRYSIPDDYDTDLAEAHDTLRRMSRLTETGHWEASRGEMVALIDVIDVLDGSASEATGRWLAAARRTALQAIDDNDPGAFGYALGLTHRALTDPNE